MRSTVFNGSTHANKQRAAEYVCRWLAEHGTAEMAPGASTGGPVEMQIGVRSSEFGLVHVTCTSSVDPQQTIWGWDPDGLAQCSEIRHVAFVWSDKAGRVLIAMLTREKALELARGNKGQYTKAELVHHKTAYAVFPAGAGVA